ncbi:MULTISPECIES: hypothetical protein [unclassified Leclercia]|uniref:hypothetical protein n=1 Tax=unclassified Leclercia TaxID=2627398 RepID=UPI0025BD5C2E|nr:MULTISPECIES: hypothetical protein [unclassified Leclercia]
MFFNTNLHLGVEGTRNPQDGSCLGIITAFKSEETEDGKTLSFTAKWHEDENAAKLCVDYLRRNLGKTFVCWLGESEASAFSGVLIGLKTHSDLLNNIYFSQIEVVFKV